MKSLVHGHEKQNRLGTLTPQVRWRQKKLRHQTAEHAYSDLIYEHCHNEDQ